MNEIEIVDVETYTIDIDEAFPASDGTNATNLSHNALIDKNLPSQHTIFAIEGLRDELNQIVAPRTVYSNERGMADYYKWADGNVDGEDRVGYFVSLCNGAQEIKICTEESDVFGVTISTSAFIGGQDVLPRDGAYSLVATHGIVNVRCESDVEIGDYITSNNYGFAKKTDIRYNNKVVALSYIDGVKYATIFFDISANFVKDFAEQMKDIKELIEKVEANTEAIDKLIPILSNDLSKQEY